MLGYESLVAKKVLLSMSFTIPPVLDYLTVCAYLFLNSILLPILVVLYLSFTADEGYSSKVGFSNSLGSSFRTVL